MYKEMYKNYSPSDFQYAYPFHFNGKCPDYLQAQNKPAYIWDYGDTVSIPFQLDEGYQGFPIYITAYNFRYEPIYQLKELMDEENNVYFELNSTDSAEIFKKGLYYCGISTIRNLDSQNEETTEYVTTLIAPNGCIFQVL